MSDDCLVYKAPKTEFNKLLRENADIVMDLLKRIYRGLDGFFLRMEYLMDGSAKNRLIAELLIIARRFGESSSEEVTVKIPLTEKDLAAYSGITRETVSRELSKLEKKGLLTFDKNTLVVKDILALENELSTN